MRSVRTLAWLLPLLMHVGCGAGSGGSQSNVQAGGSSVNPSAGGDAAVGGGAGGSDLGLGGAATAGGETTLGGLTGISGAPTSGASSTVGGATGLGGQTSFGGAPVVGGTAGAAGASVGGGGASVIDPGQWHAFTYSGATAAAVEAEYLAWKASHYATCPDGSARVSSSGDETVSEGIGYGMLMAASLGYQGDFDALTKYYFDRLDDNGLMHWKWSGCDLASRWGDNAASDADEDVAMALVIADKQWGGYATTALGLIQAIRTYETDTCGSLIVLKPGDIWGGCSDPGDKRINPSYFAPGYYRVFATIDVEGAALWNQMADDTYVLLAQYQASMGGLVPDWGYADGTGNGSNYYYDACRTPWRIATDYAWFGTAEAQSFLSGVSQWLDANGGIPNPGMDNNSAFNGSFALSGCATSQEKFDQYMQAWMSAGGDDQPYFQGSLRVLYLLVAGGLFPSTL